MLTMFCIVFLKFNNKDPGDGLYGLAFCEMFCYLLFSMLSLAR